MNDEPASAASEAIGKARAFLRRFLNRQVQIRAGRLGDRVAAGAVTIRDIGGELRKRQPSDVTERLTESLARTTDDVAAYLRASDGETLVRDARRFGRTQPAAAAAIVALGGFAAARVLKVAAGGGRSTSP